MRSVFSVLIGSLIPLTLACGGGPRAKVQSAIDSGDPKEAIHAYDTFRESEGSEIELLADVAALVLYNASQSDDNTVRKAAVQQLAYAGTKAKPTLWKIANAKPTDMIRAMALWTLSRTGDRDATPYLYALLDHDDPEILALALKVASTDDEARILTALTHDHAHVRSAAAIASAKVPSEKARLALTQMARIDPDASVRGAAVRGLVEYGSDSLEAIRERLSDPISSVRFAAVRALIQADRSGSVPSIEAMMSVQPNPAGIEAARVLCFIAEQDAEFGSQFSVPVQSARTFLQGALMAKDARLRSQAAVAMVTLGANQDSDAALRRALMSEEDLTAKFAMARALHSRPGGNAPAETVMSDLMEEGGMLRVQAAAFLVREGHSDMEEVLVEGLSNESRLIRQVSVRAIARDAMKPEEARPALNDEDALVRVHAAGAILASASAAQRRK